MKLQLKLALAFVSLSLLILVGAVLSLRGVAQQQTLLDSSIHPSLRVLNLAQALHETVSDTQRLAFQAGLERRDDLLYRAGAAAGRFFDQHEALRDALREVPSDSENLALLQTLHERIATTFRRIMASSLSLLAEQIEQGESQEAWLAQARLSSQALEDEMTAFVSMASDDLDRQMRTARKRLERMETLLRGAIAVAVFGLAVFFVFLFFHLQRPMRRIGDFVRAACADPLGMADRHVPARRDEIGELGEGINHLLDRLQDIAVSRDELKLLAKVFESSRDGITVVDIDRRFVSINPAFTKITGYTLSDVMGATPALLKSGRHDNAFYQAMWAAIDRDGHWQGEIWNKRKSGEIYPEWLNISTVRDAGGAVTHYVGIFSDITERKSNQAKIEYLAHHDALTGLPNRILLEERIAQAVLRGRRDERHVAILFLDLDNFKRINDSLGHSIGDRMLRTVAERIVRCVREVDTVSRQGGDEFIVVVGDIVDADAAAYVAAKILSALNAPIDIGSHSLITSASIGIALYPEDGTSSAQLLKNADTAMYHAKAAGRATHRFFKQEMNEQAHERLKLEGLLREALDLHQLHVYYQPLVRVSDGAIVGAEALLRWQLPERGLVPPASFIPLAEDSGLIVPIGAWVLRQACLQAAAWARGGRDLRVAVNVSAVQIKRDDLVATVGAALAESGIPPHRLELEITESLLMGDDGATRDILERLIAMGVRLSIDDFGTGYSNLAYLQRFSVDKLKIDQAFVRQAGEGGDAIAIVHAIVQMAHSLGMDVLAEGVETVEQLNLLTTLRCDEVQGYHLGRPMPAAEMNALLERGGETGA